MIKLVIFDLSDVCFSQEETPFLQQFAKRNGLNFKELENAYNAILPDAEIDKLSGIALWEQLFEQFNVQDDIRAMISEMMDLKEEKKEMLNFVNSLRPAYKTAYLTNYNKAYWDVIAERFDLSQYFDFGLVSYMIQSRKPSKKGFEALMDHFNVTPEETVFLDDKEDNLPEAVALGINVIHFTNKEQLTEQMGKLGMDV